MRFILSMVMVVMMMVSASAQDYPWRGFDRIKKPVDVTTVSIEDPSGRMIGMGALRGSWVLVNTWAAWCAPCVAELPTLERLNIAGLKVIAVSQDAGKKNAQIKSFLKRYNIGDFAAYNDAAFLMDKALPSAGLPMTYLIDPKGKVVAQYRGSAEWDSALVVQDLKRVIKAGKI